MNKELGHGENFLVKHYAGSVVYTVTGMYFMAPIDWFLGVQHTSPLPQFSL